MYLTQLERAPGPFRNTTREKAVGSGSMLPEGADEDLVGSMCPLGMQHSSTAASVVPQATGVQACLEACHSGEPDLTM